MTEKFIECHKFIYCQSCVKTFPQIPVEKCTMQKITLINTSMAPYEQLCGGIKVKTTRHESIWKHKLNDKLCSKYVVTNNIVTSYIYICIFVVVLIDIIIRSKYYSYITAIVNSSHINTWIKGCYS
jgi:hypothetical protein